MRASRTISRRLCSLPSLLGILIVCGILSVLLVWIEVLRFKSSPRNEPLSSSLKDSRVRIVRRSNDGEGAGQQTPDSAKGHYGPHQTSSKQTRGKEAASHLILQPPFHLVQLGFDRTGSTFQFTTLLKIANMKSPSGTEILARFAHSTVPTIQHQELSFVIKSHLVDEKQNWTRLVELHKVTVFSTAMQRNNLTKLSGLAVHLQMKEDLAECSACEIEKYRPYFNLTKDEIEHVKRYMSLWEKLRLCCGYTQMSRYNRARLLGCNMSDHIQLPAYPHCEDFDLEAIEQEFADMVVPAVPWGWRGPGDCAMFETIIKNQAKDTDRPTCESLLYPPTHNYLDQENENVPPPSKKVK